MNTIINEFNNAGLIFDRTVNDSFELPFSYEQIEIQPNDLAIASTINQKLEKIYINFLYLYKLCNVANYQIPKDYTGWVGCTGTNTSPASTFKVTKFSNTFPISSAVSFLSAGNKFSKINDSRLAVSFSSKLFNSPVLVTANNNTLTLVAFFYDYTVRDLQGEPFVLSQSAIDPLSGSLTFSNITGLAIDPEEEIIFVVDQNLSNVYAYDITDTISSDVIRSKKIFLSDFIGGKGTAFDRTKFNLPNTIAYTGEVLFVEDSGNKCIKAYDRNLNWLNTTILKNLFSEIQRFNVMAYNKVNNQLYACTDKNLYVLNITSDYQILSGATYNYSNLVLGTDRIVDLKFSNYDSRIFYILTQQSLIKKWTTKLNATIGIYPNNNLRSNTFRWLTNVSNVSADTLLLYNTSTNLSSCNIALFEDSLDLVSLLKDTDFTIYAKEDIFINKDEYNQAWVYSKSFKKVLYNILRLTSNIGYRFFESKTVSNIDTYFTRQYNTFFISDTAVDVNTFANVCVNENFQAATLNRNFKKIYDYQYQILTSVVNQENIRRNLLPRAVRGNNRMFDYTIYYQGTGISINPNGFKMYSNTDGFVGPGDLTISSLAPYSSGGGIIII